MNRSPAESELPDETARFLASTVTSRRPHPPGAIRGRVPRGRIRVTVRTSKLAGQTERWVVARSPLPRRECQEGSTPFGSGVRRCSLRLPNP